MKMNEDEVEEFLIEVIKTRLVRAKISQASSLLEITITIVIFNGYGNKRNSFIMDHGPAFTVFKVWI